MALKPADGTVAQQVCRVCGGEVNPHGECVVCGTKQDAPAMADQGLPSWLKTEPGEATTWLNAPGTGDSRDEALRKWLSGEDTAFQDWIGVPTTSGGALTARATPDRMSDDKVRELRSKAMEVDGIRAELESMRATLNRELSNFRQGKFDPVKYIEVNAPTEELKRRLEEELREMEQDYLAKEEQFKKRIISLEGDVNRYKIEDKVRVEAQAFEGKPKTELGGALTRKEHDVLQRERTLLLREQDLQRLQDDLQVKEDEIKKVKEPLAYKEEELLRREEDMLYREKLVQAERRKVEEAKAQGGSTEELDMKARLEELKSQINQKEEEVRTKEKYLQQKMEELRMREQGLITEDIEAREQELQIEVKQQKVKTGIPRLDDLMFGGIPFGTNASVYGPAYVGKEVLLNLFMAEGLKKGVPVLWVLTDKGPADVRDDMSFVLPGYEEYEKLALVRYIDAYSKSMGAEATDPNTTYIDDPTDHQSILKAVETTAAALKKKYPTYRLGCRSGSTLIAYLDPTTTFKFLQPFVGRRKRDKAVAFYVIEKGMHEEQEIQMLGSLMDGSIEFKVEQLKSFLSIKGICDVQSRGWIRYTYTKSSVSVGSFSLDHIK